MRGALGGGEGWCAAKWGVEGGEMILRALEQER